MTKEKASLRRLDTNQDCRWATLHGCGEGSTQTQETGGGGRGGGTRDGGERRDQGEGVNPFRRRRETGSRRGGFLPLGPDTPLRGAATQLAAAAGVAEARER